MLRVLTCLTTQHSLPMVLLAAAICAIAACTSFRIYALAAATDGVRRISWLFLTGVCTASGIWATHFISMLAYDGSVPIGYDPTLTMFSLICAVLLTTLGFGLAAFEGTRFAAAFGGAVVGVGVALMHFTGMKAIVVAGSLMWDLDLVYAAIVLSSLLSASAMIAHKSPEWARSKWTAPVLLTLAICCLHFIAMGAVTIVPDPSVSFPANPIDNKMLAIAIATLSLVVMLSGLASATIDDRSSRESAALNQELVDAAFEGLVLAKEGRIVNVNRRISELCGKAANDLIGQKIIGGLVALNHDAAGDTTHDLQTVGGTSVPVELVRRPLEMSSRANEVYAFRDLTERRRAEAELQHMAHHDPLTGLPNRTVFEQRLHQAVDRAADGEFVAIMLLDLDRFKAVNDTLGHASGDILLAAVAKRLRTNLKKHDTVARIGGDEFAIVLVDLPDLAVVDRIAKRIVNAINIPFDLDGRQATVGASIGVAIPPSGGTNPEQLLKNADLALYRVKAAGRGNYCTFKPEFGEHVARRRTLEAEMRAGLIGNEFELHYQPLFHLEQRRMSGCEALVRWRHPTRGLVSPAEFIPLAEETGFIVPLGEWIINEACRAAASWPDHIRVAVNISAVQFKSPSELIRVVIEALSASGLSSARLELEITETAILQDTVQTEATLSRLMGFGVQIALDDFCTGYSSLRSLQNFKFERLKIDQSFISEIETNRASLNIVRAVSGLAKGLGMKTTAEGIETRSQLAIVEAEGCTEVQGFLLSKALPRAEIDSLIRHQGPWAMLAPATAA